MIRIPRIRIRHTAGTYVLYRVIKLCCDMAKERETIATTWSLE